MKRWDFINLRGNVQWAITDHLVFGTALRWGYNLDKRRSWLGRDSLPYPDCVDMERLHEMLSNEKHNFWRISMSLDSRQGWTVQKNAEIICVDNNLPWAMLMASQIPPELIIDPFMTDFNKADA